MHINKILTLIIFLLLFALTSNAQQRILGRCANSAAKAEIAFNVGNINLKPCPTKAIQLNGVNISLTGLALLNGISGSTQTFSYLTGDTAGISSAGTTHSFTSPISAISGTNRTNYLPYFTGANTFGKSGISWDGTEALINNAADDSTFTFQFLPSSTVGVFDIGSPTNSFQVNQQTNSINALTGFLNMQSTGNSTINAAGLLTLTATGNGILSTNGNLSLNSNSSINLTSVSGTFVNTGNFTMAGASTLFASTLSVSTNFQLDRTISITPGNTTINKPAGIAVIGAGGNTVTVTNNLVTANSIILVNAATNDATCAVKSYQAGAGSFVIQTTANCTGITRFAFLVTN